MKNKENNLCHFFKRDPKGLSFLLTFLIYVVIIYIEEIYISIYRRKNNL